MTALAEKQSTKKRFVDLDFNFDLDLCYITETIIVIGSPYRDDSLSELKRFLDMRHKKRYKVYNLAIEEEYNIQQDLDNVETFPIPAHNPCALSVIIKFCASVNAFLHLDPKNVIVIHCRTGKGRSCMMAACYLLHSAMLTDAEDAVSFVCRQRTPVYLNAVSIPSQIRYIHYYEMMLRMDEVLCCTYKIGHIRMTTIPNFSSSIVNSGCTPHVSISVLGKKSMVDVTWQPKSLFNKPVNTVGPGKALARTYVSRIDKHVDFDMSEHNIQVRGDVCLGLFSRTEKMCQIYFNTCFVQGNYLVFEKNAIDMASNDVENFIFDANFKVEVFLQRVEDDESINVVGWDAINTLNLDEEGNEVAPAGGAVEGRTANAIWADIAIIESDDEEVTK